MSAQHAPMVVAAARVLCKRGSEQCNVDFEDSWKVYGDMYLEDAKAALDAAAAPALLEALRASIKYLAFAYSEGFAEAEKIGMEAEDAITKATGAHGGGHMNKTQCSPLIATQDGNERSAELESKSAPLDCMTDADIELIAEMGGFFDGRCRPIEFARAILAAAAQNADLSAEFESLKRDAQRYRFLSEQNALIEEGTLCVIIDDIEGGEWVGCDLDKAIDAAIAKATGSEA